MIFKKWLEKDFSDDNLIIYRKTNLKALSQLHHVILPKPRMEFENHPNYSSSLEKQLVLHEQVYV